MSAKLLKPHPLVCLMTNKLHSLGFIQDDCSFENEVAAIMETPPHVLVWDAYGQTNEGEITNAWVQCWGGVDGCHLDVNLSIDPALMEDPSSFYVDVELLLVHDGAQPPFEKNHCVKITTAAEWDALASTALGAFMCEAYSQFWSSSI